MINTLYSHLINTLHSTTHLINTLWSILFTVPLTWSRPFSLPLTRSIPFTLTLTWSIPYDQYPTLYTLLFTVPLTWSRPFTVPLTRSIHLVQQWLDHYPLLYHWPDQYCLPLEMKLSQWWRDRFRNLDPLPSGCWLVGDWTKCMRSLIRALQV